MFLVLLGAFFVAFASSVATTLYYYDTNARARLWRKRKAQLIGRGSQQVHNLQKVHGSQTMHNSQRIHNSQKGHGQQCLILNDGSLMATATTHNLVSGLKDINNNIKVDTRQYSMEGDEGKVQCFRILVVILSHSSDPSLLLECSLPVAHCPPCPLVLFSLDPTVDDLSASCTESLKRLGYYKLFHTLNAADLEDQKVLKTYLEEIATLCLSPFPPPYPIFGNKPLR